jgi:3',5'-cyclic AMP phosphodiesterase CpdA
MLRIGYITDTHIGGDGTGWCQQPPCQKILPLLFERLGQVLQRERVDILIIGGDITENGAAPQIDSAIEAFSKLPVVVRIVLGNHDLATADSFSLWKTHGELFAGDFQDPWGDFAIARENSLIIGLQNAWGKSLNALVHNWKIQSTCGGLLEGQMEWLRSVLKANSDKNVFVFLHEMLFPLYPCLTGLDAPIHVPNRESIESLSKLLRESESVKWVMSGHCHATSLHVQDKVAFATTAAFVEPPFQFRLMNVQENRLDVSTRDFGELVSRSVWDESKSWVIGREQDRNFTIDY